MNRAFRIIMIGAAASLISLLVACATSPSMEFKHPVEVPARPICSDCHRDWRSSMDHSDEYIERHKFDAAQQHQTCGICHTESFCADCHANKEELKPSDKYKNQPDRTMPHPGDYITQHRIDAKINAASCFPCHGRQSNERCMVCHR